MPTVLKPLKIHENFQIYLELFRFEVLGKNILPKWCFIKKLVP